MKYLSILVVFVLLVGCKEKTSDVKGDVYVSGFSIDSVHVFPCPIDTLTGVLYRAVEYGSYSIEVGHFIAKCGGLQIGGIPVMGQENTPIWIPGRFLRNDEVDSSGNLIYKEFQEQFNSGYFTDEKFTKVDISCVYGLLIERKK